MKIERANLEHVHENFPIDPHVLLRVDALTKVHLLVGLLRPPDVGRRLEEGVLGPVRPRGDDQPPARGQLGLGCNSIDNFEFKA